MTDERRKESGRLRRDLGLFDAVGIGLGAIIGAGLFVVTGVAAGAAGPAFLIGLILAGMAAECNALNSAQLAASIPESGGTYEYGYRLLSPWLGFAAGWMFLASKLSAAGTVALGFGAYLAAWIPSVAPRWSAMAAVILLTVANCAGIRKAGRLNTLIVAVTILALVYFIVGGIPSFDAQNLRPFAPHGWRGILESAALLFFAYTGYARLATLGEEVVEPRTTIPRAIVLALALATLLYFAVSLVAVGAVGASAMAAGGSPLIRAAEGFRSPAAADITILGAAMAMLGVLLSQILGISRMELAMARRRDLPALFAHVSPNRGIPDRAVLITGAIALVIAAFGTVLWTAAAASFTILLYYAITNLAALRLPDSERLYPRWIAWLGLGFCMLLALSLRPVSILAGVTLLALGLVLRAVFRRNVPEHGVVSSDGS